MVIWQGSHLDNSLTETDEIRSDADSPRGDHRYGDDLVVGLGRLTGDPCCCAQVFDPDVIVVPDDGGDLVPALVVVLKSSTTRRWR